MNGTEFRSKRKRPEPDAAERERIVAAINRVLEKEPNELDPFWVMLQAMVYSKDKSWADD